MKTRFPLVPLIAIALAGPPGVAQATEKAMHNDMDGDGRSDLVWTSIQTGWCADLGTYCSYWAIYVYSYAKNVSFNVYASLPKDLYTYSSFLNDKPPVLAYGDSTYDSRRSALLVRNPSSGVDYSTYPVDPNTSGNMWMKAVKFTGTADWRAVGAGDFNGDGVADLLYRNARDGSNKIQSNAGLANPWTTLSLPLVALSWNVVGIGDFDGDGRSDVLWRNPTTGQNSVWRSANRDTKLPIATLGSDWKVAAIGDFNGDKHSDIFWRNTRTGADVIWKSANSQTQQSAFQVTDLTWDVASSGDYNGDGKWDVVWRNSVTGSNVLWKSANRDTRITLPTMQPGWTLLM